MTYLTFVWMGIGALAIMMFDKNQCRRNMLFLVSQMYFIAAFFLSELS